VWALEGIAIQPDAWIDGVMRKKWTMKQLLPALCLGSLALFQVGSWNEPHPLPSCWKNLLTHPVFWLLQLGQLTGRQSHHHTAGGASTYSIRQDSSTGGFTPSSLISSSDSSNGASCRAQEVLMSCPGLPSYCPRAATPKDLTAPDYLKPEGPGDDAMAQQKALVDKFLAGPGFKVRGTCVGVDVQDGWMA
jgi:hypothetical protein